MAPTKLKKSSSSSSSKPKLKPKPSSSSSSSKIKPTRISKKLNNPKSKSKSQPTNQSSTSTTPSKKQLQKLTKLEKDLPKLNTIIPTGIIKKRKTTSKVFVEDRETMMSILNLVNESKEGKIAGKLEKSRQLEAIREARRQEQEVREWERNRRLDDKKEEIRRRRRTRKGGDGFGNEREEEVEKKKKKKSSLGAGKDRKRVKRVSFA